LRPNPSLRPGSFADSLGSIEGNAIDAPRIALCPLFAPMIVILFQCEGDVRPLSVYREATLRDVQKQLCTMFRRPFPKTKCLLNVAGVRYEDFTERPFEDLVVDFTPCRIYFEPTDDPYFYDLEDRRSTSKLTLHEELKMESEMGDTLPRRWPSGPSWFRAAREHYGEIPVFSPLMPPTHADVESPELRQSSSGE
jgi:hypothetical protein